MSYRGSGGNLAVMYAHSFTHYTIMIREREKAIIMELAVVFPIRNYQAQSATSPSFFLIFFFLNQMQVQLRIIIGYVESKGSV